LSSARGDIIPLASSGVYLFKGAPGHAVGYQVLARQYSDIRVSAVREATLNVIDDARSPGDELYIGNFDLRASTTEYWAGLCYSYQFNDWFSIGASNFGCLRYEDLDLRSTARAVNATTTTFGSDQLFGLGYWNVRVQAKVGIALDFGDLKMGFTMTTPGMHIMGGATVSSQLTVIDLDLNGDGTGQSLEASAREDGSVTRFHSPWSFASGLEYTVASTTLAFTWEWFLPVGKYKAVQPQQSKPYIRGLASGGPNSKDVLTVYDGRRGCFNVALAVENRWDKDWSGVWSFRSDYGADYMSDSGSFLGLSSWDLFHLATGIEYTTRMDNGAPKHEFAVGLQLSVGSGKGDQPVSFDNPTEANFLRGVPVSKEIAFFAIGLIVGYTYYF
jgi:hypothetical protein